MVCRTLEIGIGQTSNGKCETEIGRNKMRDQFGALAFNLRTALRRLEDLRQEVEREATKNIKENIYEVKVSVNNLAGVLKLADDNLNELEGLIKTVKVKRKTGDASTGSA